MSPFFLKLFSDPHYFGTEWSLKGLVTKLKVIDKDSAFKIFYIFSNKS